MRVAILETVKTQAGFEQEFDRLIIDELKKICGNVFVSKLDSLAKDAISSKEFALFIQEVIKE